MEQGYKDTVETLDKSGIAYCGGRRVAKLT
jgi:hypothetical protein